MNTHPFSETTDQLINYELRLGISGHRNLANPEGVSLAVEALLKQIGEVLNPHPHVPLQWVIVSPLAKGADRIVARAAIKTMQARLEVISPFAMDEYRKDFNEPEDRAEFEELLDNARTVVELKCSNVSEPAARNTGYLKVGQAVLDACEILIVVWDAREAKGHGGTGNIVNHALQQKRTVIWIDATQPSATPKLLLPAPGTPRGFTTRPLPCNAKQLCPGYHQLAALMHSNLDLEQYSKTARETRIKVEQQAEKTGVNRERIKPILEQLVPHYVRFDLLAIRYQRRHINASIAVLCLAAFAITISVFHITLLPNQLWPIVVEILAMFGALGFFIFNRKQEWHEKWIHSRLLAEQVRTAMYTTPLGEDANPPLAMAPAHLPFYVGPEGWIVNIVSQITTRAQCNPVKHRELSALKRYVIDGWLTEQSDWHAGNARRKERWVASARTVVLAVFTFGLLMAFLQLSGIGRWESGPHILAIGNWFTFLAIVLPAWGAALYAVNKQLEYERIAARSGQMSNILSRFAAEVEEASSPQELRRVVLQGAKVVGAENYEWWILLSFDPPELAA